MAAFKSKRKHEIPQLTDGSIKEGIELKSGKGKRFKSVEEMLMYVDKRPDNSAAKRKSTAKRSNRMTADEERAVAKAYREIKEGKVRTFKNADEYLKHLDTV